MQWIIHPIAVRHISSFLGVHYRDTLISNYYYYYYYLKNLWWWKRRRQQQGVGCGGIWGISYIICMFMSSLWINCFDQNHTLAPRTLFKSLGSWLEEGLFPPKPFSWSSSDPRGYVCFILELYMEYSEVFSRDVHKPKKVVWASWTEPQTNLKGPTWTEPAWWVQFPFSPGCSELASGERGQGPPWKELLSHLSPSCSSLVPGERGRDAQEGLTSISFFLKNEVEGGNKLNGSQTAI